MGRRRAVSLLGVGLVLGGLASTVRAGAEQDLEKALDSRDRAKIEAALAQVRGSLTPAAVKVLVDGAAQAQAAGLILDVVEVLGGAQGPALVELAKAYERAKASATRFLVLDALRGIPDPLADETLARAGKKDDDPAVAVHAVRLLVARGTVRAIDGLLEVLEAAEKSKARALLAQEATAGLRSLLGQDQATLEDWKKLWATRKDGWRGGGPAPLGAKPAAEPEKEPEPRRGRPGGRGGEAGGDDGTRTRTVLDRMGSKRRDDLTTLTRLEKDAIVVAEGEYDQVQDVLAALKIPCETVGRPQLETVALHPDRQVLILNCSADPLSEPVAKRVREFVLAGGYLFTSDWELGNALVKSFPECVKSGGRQSSEHTVTIQPRGSLAAHPLLRDVLPVSPLERVARPLQWKVDGLSEFVLDHEAIAVLVEAPELLPLYKTSAVAATFCFTGEPGGPGRPVTGTWLPPAPKGDDEGGPGTRTGKRGRGAGESARLPGRVLHVISHFQHQATEAGDGFALQQLLLNFVLEKQAARRAAAGR